MEVHSTSPISSRQVLPRPQIPCAPIRRRSKQRTSPIGPEERTSRRYRPEPDHSDSSAFFHSRSWSNFGSTELVRDGTPHASHGTSARILGAQSGVDRSHRDHDALSNGDLTPGRRTGSEFGLLGSGGPPVLSNAQPASQFTSVPNPNDSRPTYGMRYHNHSLAYNYTHAQSDLHDQGRDTPHDQHYPPHASYHTNEMQWYGTPQAQHGHSYAASHHSAQLSSEFRSLDSISSKQLPLRTSPASPAPLLQAEVSLFATAASDRASPHSLSDSRDPSQLLQHDNQHRSAEALAERSHCRYPKIPPSNPTGAQNETYHASALFRNQAPLGELAHSMAQSAAPVSLGGAGVGSRLLDFAAFTTQPAITENHRNTAMAPSSAIYYTSNPASTVLVSPDVVENQVSVPPGSHRQHRRPASTTSIGDLSQYRLGYSDSFQHQHALHDRFGLASALEWQPTAATRVPSTYAEPTHMAAGLCESYDSPPANLHLSSQHREYQDRSEVAHRLEPWVVGPRQVSSVEDAALPQHPLDQQAHRPTAGRNEMISRLPSINGASGPSGAVSGSVNSRRLELAAPPGRAQRPDPSKKARKPKQLKTRGKFSEDKRKETALTRKRGACIRCKCQRVRCEPSDPDNPDAPCEPCSKVNQNSKKKVHDCSCRRYKLSDMVLSRQGGLGLTARWQGTQMKDVGDRVDDIVRVVEIKIFYSHDPRHPHLYHQPIKLNVRKFRPRQGDVLVRRWKTRDNVGMVTQMTAFALDDVNAAAADVDRFICDHTVDAMRWAVRDSELIVRETYEMAITHYASLKPGSEQHTLLGHLFKLWFAMRLTTGSAYVSGPDKLDMVPDPHPDYPLGDKISLPRMITAQVDCILSTKFLKTGTRMVSQKLEALLRSNNSEFWFTIYLACFIVLHEISVATMDRGRYARDNQLPTRFSLPSVVRDQHFTANNLLAHWHYFKTDYDPSNAESENVGKTPLAWLNEDEKNFIWRWWYCMTQPGVLEHLCPDDEREQKARWEHPLYFVCQMFMRPWKEKATYQG